MKDEAELFRIEDENYRKLEEKYPEKMVRAERYDPLEALNFIGISGVKPSPTGYLRYYPQDFIVEEVQLNDEQTTIEPLQKPAPIEAHEDQTIYADAVKIGIGTFEVVNRLASRLGIAPQRVSYAGMKDGRALTSQRIGIRGSSVQAIEKLPRGHFFLKLRHAGKGVIAPGQLTGNRFTITVRTEQPIDEAALTQVLSDLAAKGFPNFFGTQRFGHRLINTHLGMFLSQGNFDKAIETFLTANGPFDVPIYESLRQKGKEAYGNWKEMKRIYGILPYKFRHEIALLNALLQGERPDRALYAIQDQVRFWFYSYGSFLVNQFLSQVLAGNIEVLARLPIPQTSDEADRLFAPHLRRDGTNNYQRHIRKLSFIRRKPRHLPAWIMPQVHGHTLASERIVTLDFSLPKGVYATTFLMFLFRCHGGNPVPSWIDDTEFDAKEALGTGSVAAALEQLEMPVQKRIFEDA